MAKVFQGVVVVVLLLAFGIAWRLVFFHYGTVYLQDTVRTSMVHIAAQAARNTYVLQQQMHGRAPVPSGRQLAANERCVGGSIVRVDKVAGVPTYTQESDGVHPLACPQMQ